MLPVAATITLIMAATTKTGLSCAPGEGIVTRMGRDTQWLGWSAAELEPGQRMLFAPKVCLEPILTDAAQRTNDR